MQEGMRSGKEYPEVMDTTTEVTRDRFAGTYQQNGGTYFLTSRLTQGMSGIRVHFCNTRERIFIGSLKSLDRFSCRYIALA